MTRFIQHSSEWPWMPPIPRKFWEGWWINNDDGEPMAGPMSTKEEAEAEFAEWMAGEPGGEAYPYRRVPEQTAEDRLAALEEQVAEIRRHLIL